MIEYSFIKIIMFEVFLSYRYHKPTIIRQYLKSIKIIP